MAEQTNTFNSGVHPTPGASGSWAWSRDPLVVRHIIWLTVFFWGLLGGAFFLHRFTKAREAETLSAQTRADVAGIAQNLQARIEQQLNPFRGLARRWNIIDVHGKRMAVRAESMVQIHRFFRCVGWMDADGTCRWIKPEGVDGTLVGQQLPNNPDWAVVVAEARRSGQIAARRCGVSDEGLASLHVALPMLVDNTESGSGAPLLVATLLLDTALNGSIGSHIRQEYDLELSGPDGAALRFGAAHGAGEAYGAWQTVRILNSEWRLSMRPNDATVAMRMGRLTTMILIAGSAGAFLFTASLWQVMYHRGREVRRTAEHLAALESLNQISAAVSAKLGTGQELLEQLAESARGLLKMSQAGILLLDEQKGELRVSVFAGNIPEGVPTSFPLARMPATRKCLETGEILFVQDVPDIPQEANKRIFEVFGAEASVLIPLSIENRAIGVMAFSDNRARIFTDADRRLARLLGSQASVILTNNRLYEQAMRDAGTNAVLLRELQHRVRNNLAGIIGLLSTNLPEMRPNCRQWLDRVIERIHNMDRAHSLFAGGLPEVNLHELIEQVLASLSVIKPPDVVIHTNLEADVKFQTTRAVSLAMVLHELCSNAMRHGLADSGTLTIESRASESGITIDVIDDGRGMDFEKTVDSADEQAKNEFQDLRRDVAASTVVVERGMGLTLVRELVGRELKGRFALRGRPGGGTIATIEFPTAD